MINFTENIFYRHFSFSSDFTNLFTNIYVYIFIFFNSKITKKEKKRKSDVQLPRYNKL